MDLNIESRSQLLNAQGAIVAEGEEEEDEVRPGGCSAVC